MPTMNLQRSVIIDKIGTRRRLYKKGNEIDMKNRSTYALLVQSEEKSRNILETALYALFALSAVVSIWQFAQQPMRLPIDGPTISSQHHVSGSRNCYRT